jgi:hypothetical protein
MLAEVLWILAGRDDVAFVKPFSRTISSFLPPGSLSFPDAYGPRIRRAGQVDQLSVVLETLRRDRATRRALMSFWMPAVDGGATAHAVPCNIAVDFKLRDDGLRMTVFNRSNDLHIGVLFNLVQFGMIGEVIAASLGVKLVRQTHITTSLHLYTMSPIHQRLSASGIKTIPVYSYVNALPVGHLDVEMIAQACRYVESGVSPYLDTELTSFDKSPWLSGAVQLLNAHRAFEDGDGLDDFSVALALLGRAPRSDWWILAAENFMHRLNRRPGRGAQNAREEVAALVAPLGREVATFVMSGLRGTDGE